VSKLFALVLLLVAFAGCSEEGRTIDVPLRVRAWAVGQYNQAGDSIMTAEFKIGAITSNPCETQHVLYEVRQVAIGNGAYTRHIRPVARYVADDPCINQPAADADTVGLLIVKDMLVVHHFQRINNIDTLTTAAFEFNVDSEGEPASGVVVDSVAFFGQGSIRFEIRALARATNAAVAGATVQVDDLTTGTPVSLGSGVTDGAGLFVLTTPATGALFTPVLPYRVTVTNGSDVVVFSVRTAKARVGSRERVFVRI
jgi:hypothetical protein